MPTNLFGEPDWVAIDGLFIQMQGLIVPS